MKYLTKQWYQLSQLTNLYCDLKIINEADTYDESLYLKLFNNAQDEYVNSQREHYDVDPRFMLEDDGGTLLALDKFVLGGALTEEDILVYEMPDDQKEYLQELIKTHDSRPPFNEGKSLVEFKEIHEMNVLGIKGRIPEAIYNQIADMRVFALGYCTDEIYDQLLKCSEDNSLKTELVVDSFYKAQQSERIPEVIKDKFGFHDCRITDFIIDGDDISLLFDNFGQFTKYNRITYKSAKINQQESEIVGSYWVHEELYCMKDGYEVHMLLAGDDMHEFTLTCSDVVID